MTMKKIIVFLLAMMPVIAFGQVITELPTKNSAAGDCIIILANNGEDTLRIISKTNFLSDYVAISDTSSMFDDVNLTLKEVPIQRVINSTIPDAPSLNTKVEGGKLRIIDSAVPTDVAQYYQVGDIVWNNAPTAGGKIGWVCTTAGYGGTAVWKPFGAIDV